MIRVSMEVCAEANSFFRVEVQARSVQQAVNITERHYPGATVQVVFPLDPETFFVKDDAAAAEWIGIETPERLVG